jgi:hypothetical protein
MDDQDLLAQLAAQIAAAMIIRSTGTPAQPTPESLVSTSIEIAKAILEAAKGSPSPRSSFFGSGNQ